MTNQTRKDDTVDVTEITVPEDDTPVEPVHLSFDDLHAQLVGDLAVLDTPVDPDAGSNMGIAYGLILRQLGKLRKMAKTGTQRRLVERLGEAITKAAFPHARVCGETHLNRRF